ncbi:MAG: nucleotidyl transferase AbiEii/AbiGii toxin family protein [Flavobacteriales bacterium]|nr:nucleotidyl transferase AbiEii/AbiGii toxin family protein [Flavobacteriales bacterium]MEB2342750.1 nucleotidyl transferase AbiEii/AbiGii toxin family protein [Flavobacteriia bacterium]
MIGLDEIKRPYPEVLHVHEGFLLREYLQYRILAIIFSSPFADKLVFLGGTCLRIVHGNRRFSEDLDFDNLGLDRAEFAQVGELVGRELELEGYEVTTEMAGIAAFRCRVRLPGLLFRHGLSGHKEQSILIQLDTEPQRYTYEPEPWYMARWDIRQDIRCCPLPLLLAQKCHAIIDRKRAKGRDFFDVSFLLGLNVQPDLGYTTQKLGLASTETLATALLKRTAQLDLEALARDVEKFLFDANGRLAVTRFPQLIRQQWLR